MAKRPSKLKQDKKKKLLTDSEQEKRIHLEIRIFHPVGLFYNKVLKNGADFETRMDKILQVVQTDLLLKKPVKASIYTKIHAAILQYLKFTDKMDIFFLDFDRHQIISGKVKKLSNDKLYNDEFDNIFREMVTLSAKLRLEIPFHAPQLDLMMVKLSEVEVEMKRDIN